jgi:hypothetical protein
MADELRSRQLFRSFARVGPIDLSWSFGAVQGQQQGVVLPPLGRGLHWRERLLEMLGKSQRQGRQGLLF